MSDIETINDFMVGAAGDELIMLLPPRRPMTKDQALRLAAWLVLLADPLEERFREIKQAVANT